MSKEKTENPFQIDSDDLWAEWARMPGRTRDACVRVADARHEYNQAKARLDIERARLFHQIRKSPGNFDLPDGKAPSNEVASSMVEIQPSYEKALNALNNAKYALDVAEADAEAYLSMRKTLENMVELLQLQYHSEREPRPLSGESRDRIDRRKRDAGGGVDVE